MRRTVNRDITFVFPLFWLCLVSSASAQLFVPIYSADPVRRARQLGNTSENLRMMHEEWERFWFFDQPSALTPFPNYGGGPYVPNGARIGGSFVRRPAVAPRAPRIVVVPADRRAPVIVDRKERLWEKEKRDAEEMLELFALGERAETNGKTKLAKIYFRMVSNGAVGVLKEAADLKLAALDGGEANKS